MYTIILIATGTQSTGKVIELNGSCVVRVQCSLLTGLQQANLVFCLEIICQLILIDFNGSKILFATLSPSVGQRWAKNVFLHTYVCWWAVPHGSNSVSYSAILKAS